jgi:hypothetical protein
MADSLMKECSCLSVCDNNKHGCGSHGFMISAPFYAIIPFYTKGAGMPSRRHPSIAPSVFNSVCILISSPGQKSPPDWLTREQRKVFEKL